jgi:hypothetical protein
MYRLCCCGVRSQKSKPGSAPTKIPMQSVNSSPRFQKEISQSSLVKKETWTIIAQNHEPAFQMPLRLDEPTHEKVTRTFCIPMVGAVPLSDSASACLQPPRLGAALVITTASIRPQQPGAGPSAVCEQLQGSLPVERLIDC